MASKRSSLILAALAVAGGLVLLPGSSAAAAPPPCRGGLVRVTGLPSGGAPGLANLAGARPSLREEPGGGFCSASGTALVARPVEAGSLVYYPSTSTGPSLALRLGPTAPGAALVVSYEDAAPTSTLVLPGTTATELSGGPRAQTWALRPPAGVRIVPGDALVLLATRPGEPATVLEVLATSFARGGVVATTRATSPFAAFTRGHLVVAGRGLPGPGPARLGTRPARLGGAPRATAGTDTGWSGGCGSSTSLSANASLTFSPTANFSLTWQWVHVGPWYSPVWVPEVNGSMLIDPNAVASLTLAASAADSCSANYSETDPDPLAQFPTDFGDFSLCIGAKFSVGATVASSMSQTFTDSSSGGVEANFSFGPAGNSFNPSDTLAWQGSGSSSAAWSGSASASAGPFLGLFYGLECGDAVGVTAGATDKVGVVTSDSGWTLTASTAASAGVALNLDIPGTSTGVNLSASFSWPLGSPVTLASGTWSTGSGGGSGGGCVVRPGLRMGRPSVIMPC
jgi:hypothetical protein